MAGHSRPKDGVASAPPTTRPSTPCLAAWKDVDARDKRGHDERKSYAMTLPPSGFLRIGASDLEYRMIGPAPDEAPTIVMLHEGLGSAALWGDFPDKLQAATG